MAYFPQPQVRLQSLSVYLDRARVIGIKAVAAQMYRDGKPIDDVRAVLRAMTH